MLAISSWTEMKLWSTERRFNLSNTSEKFIVHGRLAVASTSLCLVRKGAMSAMTKTRNTKT
ncbi:hypothetical protein CY34DRAFT_797522 [Suillus luteus UH-Slu-Lm8-n1]|uniref:Uncharacterized protein n=1 Tax=Suillus luteus UH-Slu-Lm8-n1 TaxID=930992 RepID=A0A0D0AG28_9AGAM|nr:hypothetical protein CY34DRAFT_797522 [Suillus luteus UH-Slu-Lm8-n1]